MPNFSTLLASTSAREQWPMLRQWIDEYTIEIGDYLRNNRPVLVTDDCVLLSRYKDVIKALENPTVFTVQLYKPKMGSYLMTEDDTPIHNDDKAVMAELLSRENLAEARRFIAQASQELIKNKVSMNLVAEYSKLVPALLVQNVFGLDGIAPRRLIKFSYWNQFSAFRNQEIHPGGIQENVERRKFWSNIHMSLYLALLLLRKQWKLKTGKPDDDTVTRLIQQTFSGHGSPRFFRKTLNTGGLLIGAIETTSEAVIHVLMELSKRPQIFEKARKLAKQESVAEFDKLCWEALRHRPIAPYIMRKLASDYTFINEDGTQIHVESGQVVLCLISSAMFDEHGFHQPDLFNAERDFGNSFHFGHGHHACLGHAFGKMLVPEMLRQLFRKPGFDLAGDMEYKGQPFPAYLPVVWRETVKTPSSGSQRSQIIDNSPA